MVERKKEELWEEMQTNHRLTKIDILGTANGTMYIKQVEIVYTGKKNKKRLKNEKEICGQQSEGHEMNRAQRPSGVCPGDM